MFTTIAFLVMAIGVTVFNQVATPDYQSSDLRPAAAQSGEYTAVSVNSHDFSRSEKLQIMKDKIAASKELSITAPDPVEVIEEVQATTSSSTAPELADELQLCPTYAASNISWSPTDVQIQEAEGVRLVYRSQQTPAVPENTGSTSQAVATQPQRDILAQLPVRNIPAARPSCISTDIIGIATDGSLIRNDEAGVYGIFDNATLVGYALDGFPIYGSAAAAGDACGGVMTAQGYRYQISPQRDTIIHCYSANPIRL